MEAHSAFTLHRTRPLTHTHTHTHSRTHILTHTLAINVYGCEHESWMVWSVKVVCVLSDLSHLPQNPWQHCKQRPYRKIRSQQKSGAGIDCCCSTNPHKTFPGYLSRCPHIVRQLTAPMEIKTVLYLSSNFQRIQRGKGIMFHLTKCFCKTKQSNHINV